MPRPMRAQALAGSPALLQTGRKIQHVACILLAMGMGAPGLGVAQNVLSDLDEGRQKPNGWFVVGADGGWIPSARNGHHALLVRGNGRDQVYWRTESTGVKPGSLYRLSFFGRSEGETGDGAAFAGLNRVNRDFIPTVSWQRFAFVLDVPADDNNEFARLGQWHLRGGMYFSEAQLLPVVAVHKRIVGGAELGEGERILGGVYRFRPSYNWLGGSYHRPLLTNRASFNSDRWVFSSGAEVIYRLGIDHFTQVEGKVGLSINYFVAGSLRMDASRDGLTWVTIATYDGKNRGGSRDLPKELFPVEHLFVRLSCQGTNGNLQVNSFEYESHVAQKVPDVDGVTHFIEIQHSSPQIALSLGDVRGPTVDGQWRLECTLSNLSSAALILQGALGLDNDLVQQPASQRLEPHAGASWTLACPTGDPGEHELTIRVKDDRGATLFAGRVPVLSNFLLDRRPGYRLGGIPDLSLWWCESAWKIGRERPLPDNPLTAPFPPVTVSAARGEYEPVQIILNPTKACRLASVRVPELRDARGRAGDVTTTVNEVAYVRVTRPTDPSCLAGSYPDPLPVLESPLELRAGQNHPLWITFHVGPNATAGDYKGELLLDTTLGRLAVPIQVHVYNFQLPDRSHLKSAIGLSVGDLHSYHRLKSTSDRIAVFKKYMLDFSGHRLSPLSFYEYSPIEVQFAGEGKNRQARVDFTRFDQAATEAIDQLHFNSFRIPLRGMPTSSSQNHSIGDLDSFKQGTPEYDALFRDYMGKLETHLRERHWLDMAYAYWFDEPKPDDYDFVAGGMARLKEAAPGIRRMLTATPDSKLFGRVDIWCGMTYLWTPALMAERRAAGEEIWWYICTSPKAPYITEFIDHPGTELRLWPWQSWQYGVSGILIWNAAYWNSATAFPEPKQQDPWADPMSYVSGPGLAPGFVGVWGNGDGRFLYPPRTDSRSDSGPILEGPVNSVRWENLRDGMEDYEYFWLLQQAIERAAASGTHSNLLADARGLLTVPAEISRDLTQFTTDPRLLLAHRDRIARMIEKLQDQGGN